MIKLVRSYESLIHKSYKRLKEDWREDNNKISDLVWEIESTGDSQKIEQCYDFIHHACDNIDDVFDGNSYYLEDATWGYGINYILDELTNILNGYGDDFYKVESYKRLKEQDVEIDVKHEGILEVPEGKNVDDLPMSHFEKLAKKKGLGKITKALNNLQVWNKKKDPKLSKWAVDMIDNLNKKLKKDESISVKRFNEGWYNGNAAIAFAHNDDLEADLEEFLFDLFSDNPDVFEFDWYGKDTKLYLSCSEEDYKYIEWFIEDWKYKHRDEYDEYD